MLESLGVSSEAANVYQMILGFPHDGVAGITKRLGWPQHRVRAALDELADLSLVRPSWREPGSLRVVNPEVSLAALLAVKEHDLAERQEHVTELRLKLSHAIDEYSGLYRTRQHEDIERLTDIDEIRSRIEGLASQCKASMMAFVPRGVQSPEVMAASRPLDLAVLARDVLMRTVYVHGLYNDPLSADYARWLVASGAQVRTTASLALRMIIYDHRFAIVPMNPAAESTGAILLHGTGVVSALCELFEQTWQQALPFDAQRERKGEKELAGQEAAVVRMLAMGQTDTVIARRLGVSVRTTRRITAELMSRLGARSRFQAGVRAAELGWLDD